MSNSGPTEGGKGDVDSSWWKKRSRLEKKLIILAVITVILIIALVIVIIVYVTRSSTTCLTQSCVHTANEILEFIDVDADPCEDFYQFACGSFNENLQLDDEPYESLGSHLYDTVHDHIRDIIEGDEEEDEPRSITLAKRLYRACMNETAIEQKGLRLIKDSLRQIGGWPALEGNNWNEKEFDWKLSAYKLRELGYSFEFFIVLLSLPDKSDHSRWIIKLLAPSNPFYAEPEHQELLHDLMVNISVAFGADRSRARNEFKEVLEFAKNLFPGPDEAEEEKLNFASDLFHGSDEQKEEEEREEDTHKHDLLRISELQYKLRDIPWLEYINRLLFPAPNISYDQFFVVSNMAYFIRLQDTLRRTQKRVLANYIAWRTVAAHNTHLTQDISTLFWNYIRRTNKLHPEPPRSRFCSQEVEGGFSLALQAEYVRKHFALESKEHVGKMLQNIKNEFRDVITNLDWMDEETRIKALKRLTNSKNYIGFPDDLLESHNDEERYRGMQIEEDNFLASLLNTRYYATNFRFRSLHEPPSKAGTLQRQYATQTSSYYFADENSITVPAGFLQGIIYDEHRPQYLNYGALGATLAQHVFHTVFEEAKFSINPKNYNFLSPHTLLTYNKKLSCIVNHFRQVLVMCKGYFQVNSSNGKYEYIANIGGIKLAYDAYDQWVDDNGKEQNLPGLDYTQKQLFWVAATIPFCGKSSVALLERSQSSYRFTALGTLRNLEEFSKDFNCPVNSYMNVEDKCSLW